MSTVEVESVISFVLEQTDSVVYGVDVPGVEGKAGMAAIVEDAAKFDLNQFLSRIKVELPVYAIPLFIRVVGALDVTGNIRKIKHSKIYSCQCKSWAANSKLHFVHYYTFSLFIHYCKNEN